MTPQPTMQSHAPTPREARWQGAAIYNDESHKYSLVQMEIAQVSMAQSSSHNGPTDVCSFSKGTLLLKAAERIALRLRLINSQRRVRVFSTLSRDAGRGL